MVLYRSKRPELDIPDYLTTWDWLFEDNETSPLYRQSSKPLGAFIDAETNERLNWREVKSKCSALSTCLIKNYGLSPGDTVSVFSGNSIWYPVAMFATVRAGARVSGASPALTVGEMVHALKVTRTKILIVALSGLKTALDAARQAGIPETQVFLLAGKASSVQSIQDLIESGSTLQLEPPFQIPQGQTNKDICGYLNLSSGTTGLPKAVMISHHNVIADCYLARQIQFDPENFEVVFAVMPLFHITGTWRFCHYPVLMNADGVMLPKYSLEGMLQAVVKYRIDEIVSVPPILLRLARDPIVSKYDLSHVKLMTSGAAPCSPEMIKSLEERFPKTRFRQGYGATEAAFVTANSPTHYDWKYGASTGMLVANTSAKAVDTEGRELEHGEVGEILVKGPQVAMGYLDNQKATTDSFDADGFYHTGDAGYFDDEGMMFIKDRIKEMIKVNGSQVPPAELEDLLLGHEDVADCAVIAQPNEYTGEVPKAYVVLKPGVPITAAAGHRLMDYVKKNKVRYKWLVEVEFVDKIPKSAAGKLLRRVLRDRERTRNNTEVASTHGLRVRDQRPTRSAHSKKVSISIPAVDEHKVTEIELSPSPIAENKPETIVGALSSITGHRLHNAYRFLSETYAVPSVGLLIGCGLGLWWNRSRIRIC